MSSISEIRDNGKYTLIEISINDFSYQEKINFLETYESKYSSFITLIGFIYKNNNNFNSFFIYKKYIHDKILLIYSSKTNINNISFYNVPL